MNNLRILIFGDSIGQGFYDEIGGGWVQRLQRDFFRDSIEGKNEVNIINLSVSGHTSHDVLKRVQFETEMRSRHDILTVLAIGTNDSYERSGIRCTEEDIFEQNIIEIIKIAQSFGKMIILGVSACVDDRVQPTAWDSTVIYKNELLRRYEGILEKVAAINNIDFVPLWLKTNKSQQNEETLPDGIHPNAAGHELIYNEVKKKLEGLIS